ncbi:MAG: NAD(P)H-hydrate dehydratase [Gammaproteobacteria bacterium]|nr:NAD(P)H-hydrate dehydratase [Gammaproteobacteria bacterium]
MNNKLLKYFATPRPRTAHKGDFGHVLVIGGDHGMAGSVGLAAIAALRVGAGRVSVVTRTAHITPLIALRPELMVHGMESAEGLPTLLPQVDGVLIGPGLGQDEWGQSVLNTLLAAWNGPLVMDADALNLLALQPQKREQWILTPHPGEAGRLLGIETSKVQQDRETAIASLVERFGGVVVLKGAGTLVLAEEAPMSCCHKGNPGMATAGMGDVLAGVIAGLSAQGLSPLDAANIGVYIHALAGDRAAEKGERGMLAGDVLLELRNLVNP